MAGVRSSALVGRRTEIAGLRAALAAAKLSGGGAHALVGPPGIGKSRLVREAAAAAEAWGLPVLVGRAVETGSGPAFRPLTESLLAGLRHRSLPEGPALAPFRPVLGRIVPQWHTAVERDDSLVVLGEGVLRLLAALAGEAGLMLVLEDLHWADPETLAVVEYLADNLAGGRIMLVVTARDDPGPVLGLLRRLTERRSCTAVTLAPLEPDEVDEMAAACLGHAAPDGVRAALQRRARGVPLLIEEMLAAGADPDIVVPATVSELMAGRLQALPRVARQCLEAAAVLGEQFDWRILAAVLAVSGTDMAAVFEAWRAVLGAGLVDPATGDEFRFHHALARDAVLGVMSPSERVEWAQRGLAAVVEAHPDLEGPWCGVAADLALGSGDLDRAAGLLLEAGRRSLAVGALTTAETVLARARQLLGETPMLLEVDEVLAEVLAQAGKTGPAITVTLRSVDHLRRNPGAGTALAGAHLRLARIHATSGSWATADEELAAASACAPDETMSLRITGVAARVALGAARFDEARQLAEKALAPQHDRTSSDVVVDALLVLGRITRREDLAGAEALFERARAVADDAGLVVAATRALDEIAIGDVQESLRLDRLEEARTRASELGDIAGEAVLNLQMIATHNSRWEPHEALQAAARCVRASRRFHLPTLSKALVLGAAASDYLGRADDAEAACLEALDLDPDDTHLEGEVWGIRAYRALAEADDLRAMNLLDRAMDTFALRPNEVTGSPAVGLWVLVHTVMDPSTQKPPATPDPVANRWNRGLVRFADAVSRGRLGDHLGAASAFAEACAVLSDRIDAPWYRLQGRRLVALAALADGWGEPARWAHEDLPQVEEHGQERWATALRGIIRRGGGAVPRRGRGDTGVPTPLRALGVTSRETDVLLLVFDGLSTTAIAQRLFLSPRTIEKHLERLMAKTRTTRRPELVAYARLALVPPPDAGVVER